MIPKIIHQTYYSRSAFVGELVQIEDNIQHLKDMNPQWSYQFYDDDDAKQFISDKYGSAMLTAYLSINAKYGAARADLFRYLLMYELGGVYLDIKSSSSKPLDSVIGANNSYILSRWANPKWATYPELKNIGVPEGREFQQWHIIAEPKHPFLEAVINRVMQNIASYDPLSHGVGKLGTLRTTGPIAYTKAIFPLMATHYQRSVYDNVRLGLIYSIFSAQMQQDHVKKYKTHYSQQTAPIILK